MCSTVFTTRDGQENLDLLGFSLRSTWELDNGRFVSISGYEENQRFVEDAGQDCSRVRVSGRTTRTIPGR